jgi:hypothetical protein
MRVIVVSGRGLLRGWLIAVAIPLLVDALDLPRFSGQFLTSLSVLFPSFIANPKRSLPP